MKTIEEWFETLPEPYKSAALNEIIEDMRYVEVGDLADAIDEGLYWLESDRGWRYWDTLYDRAIIGTITAEES